MFELMFCSMLTILPDYLYRRYVQGKRIGHEITLYSVWFELRWGIIGCVLLTVSLITLIFYFHPSTKSAVSFYRTVPILPEGSGRVAEVHIGVRDEVEEGQPVFTLDNALQRAQVVTAEWNIREVEAEFEISESEIEAAEGRLESAEGALQQVADELETKSELFRRDASVVPEREIEQLQVALDEREGGVHEARANLKAIEKELSVLLPAKQASAEAALEEAQVALDRTIVRAGVSGRVEQFTLREGDIVNPLMRPAGILVPSEAGRKAILAGFGQIEAQIMKPGMAAEVVCVSVPYKVIPMVVTEVQDVIAAGQLGPSDKLVDALNIIHPGTITVFLEPMYEGGIDNVTPGSNCVANAYTSNHDRLHEDDVSTAEYVFLHVVDTVGLVHAMLLRLQALVLPVRTLVLSGH